MRTDGRTDGPTKRSSVAPQVHDLVRLVSCGASCFVWLQKCVLTKRVCVAVSIYVWLWSPFLVGLIIFSVLCGYKMCANKVSCVALSITQLWHWSPYVIGLLLYFQPIKLFVACGVGLSVFCDYKYLCKQNILCSIIHDLCEALKSICYWGLNFKPQTSECLWLFSTSCGAIWCVCLQNVCQ